MLKVKQRKPHENSRIFIEGRCVCLREIRLSDANENYCDWMNNSKINQYLESRFEKWSIKKLKNYVNKTRRNTACVFLAITAKGNNKHIGNVKIGPINWIHKFADVGIIIGEKSFWGKGIATEVIKLVIDYSFHKLNLHKLTAGAYSNNIASIKAFKKVGFSVEGVRKKHYLCDGIYVDGVLLGIVQK
jgi:ribosomal-protein-alanine N-acetyltransferase